MLPGGKSSGGFHDKVRIPVNASVFETCETLSYFYHTAISLLSNMQPSKNNFHLDIPQRFVNPSPRLLLSAV